MLKKYNKKIKGKPEFLYTGIFLIIACTVLYIFKHFSLINSMDGFNQNYCTQVYCGKFLRELFRHILNCIKNGNFKDLTIPQFDFSIGMGEGIIPTLNYYGFGDPFMLLTLFVPVAYSAYAYTGISLLKIYISGLAFIQYCKNRSDDTMGILAGTVVYITSGYVLVYGFLFPQFLNAMITLPILCAGIDNVIEKKKNISLYIIFSVAFQGVSNFYQLYMVLLFAGIYGLVEIIQKNKKASDAFCLILNLFFQVLWGIALCGIILLPAILAFLSSNRANSFFEISNILQIDKDVLKQLFLSISIPNGYDSQELMLPAFAIFLIVAYKIKDNVDIKIMLSLMILAYILGKVSSWIAGGFSNTIYYYRWSFCFYFVFAIVLCLVMENVKSINMRCCILFMILWGCYASIICYLNTSKLNIVILYTTILVIQLVLFVILPYKKELIVIAILCNVLVNVHVIFATCHEKIDIGAKWNYDLYYDVSNKMQASSAQKYTKQKEENSFYRLDITGNARNESLYIGYYGIAEYLSILNKNILDFFQQYGLSSEMPSSFAFEGLNGREALEDLLSVKYFDMGIKDEIEENENYLPLGFTYTNYITTYQADSLSILERNVIALNTLVLDNEVTSIRKQDYNIEDSLYEEADANIQYFNILRDGDKIVVDSDSKITVEYKSNVKGEVYCYIAPLLLEKVDGVEATQYFGKVKHSTRMLNDPYFNGLSDCLIRVGECDKGQGTLEITFEEPAEYILGEMHIYVLDAEKIESDSEQRGRNHLENVRVDTNKVCGKISVEEPQILFLSIPYSKGWKAKVDGEYQKIIKADYGFMALEINEGEHIIELEYCTPGIHIGMILSLLGIGLLIWYMTKRKVLNEL